jgi:TPR repeat protein
MPKKPRPIVIKLEDVIPKREREEEQQLHPRQRCCSSGPEAAVSLASGQYFLAAAQLQEALLLGHLPSRASLAWILAFGRQGVAKDRSTAFELVKQGACLGCHDCQGVYLNPNPQPQSLLHTAEPCQGMVALCRALGYGCTKDPEQALRLARESAVAGSK